MNDSELKREIIDTRNQMIKVDNQVTNLGLDIKKVEKRFDEMERRVRIAGIGAHVVVAAVLGLAAVVVVRAQASSLASKMEDLERSAEQAKTDGLERNRSLQARVAKFERARQDRERAEKKADQILRLVDAGSDSEAARLLLGFDSQTLTALERSLFEARVLELRQRSADASYRSGRRALEAGRLKGAQADFQQSIALSPEGRFSDPARYSLMIAFWRMGEFDKLKPLADHLTKTQQDRNVLDEVAFMKASGIAHSGKPEVAKPLLESLTRSRFGSSAKRYLSAIQEKKPLPEIPGAQNR